MLVPRVSALHPSDFITSLNSCKSIRPVSSESNSTNAFHIIGNISSRVISAGERFLPSLKPRISTSAATKHMLNLRASAVFAPSVSTTLFAPFLEGWNEKSCASGATSISRRNDVEDLIIVEGVFTSFSVDSVGSKSFSCESIINQAI